MWAGKVLKNISKAENAIVGQKRETHIFGQYFILLGSISQFLYSNSQTFILWNIVPPNKDLIDTGNPK